MSEHHNSFRLVLYAISAFTVAFALGVAAVAAVELLRIKASEKHPTSPEAYFGISAGYHAYVVIKEIDLASSSAIVTIRSNMTNQDIDTRIHFTEDLRVTRRDVIFEDGVLTGFGDVLESSRNALLPGIKGIGTIQEKDGKFYLSYLIMGFPFPRP